MCNEKEKVWEKFFDNFHARDQFKFYAFYEFYQILLHDKKFEFPCAAVENISGAFFDIVEQNAQKNRDVSIKLKCFPS